MYFERGLTVAAIASALGHRQRQLYTRRDRCLRQLSDGLAKRGLDPAEVLDALDWVDASLEIDYDVEDEPQELRPSN